MKTICSWMCEGGVRKMQWTLLGFVVTLTVLCILENDPVNA